MVYQAVPSGQGNDPASIATNEPKRDGVMGLLDRASFNVAVERFADGASGREPASLVFVDIDDFKNVNTVLGHPGADRVLIEIARRLESVCAGKGEIYRYGGDELVLILPNHSADEGAAVAERARRILEESPNGGLTVTASFGVAEIPKHAGTSTDWIARADSAVFEAKKHRRNIVWVFGDAPPTEGSQRKPVRKDAPPAELLSEGNKEEMRKKLIHGEAVFCPVDQMPLTNRPFDSISHVGRNYIVTCPGCGYCAKLESLERNPD